MKIARAYKASYKKHQRDRVKNVSVVQVKKSKQNIKIKRILKTLILALRYLSLIPLISENGSQIMIIWNNPY